MDKHITLGAGGGCCLAGYRAEPKGVPLRTVARAAATRLAVGYYGGGGLVGEKPRCPVMLILAIRTSRSRRIAAENAAGWRADEK